MSGTKNNKSEKKTKVTTLSHSPHNDYHTRFAAHTKSMKDAGWKLLAVTTDKVSNQIKWEST